MRGVYLQPYLHYFRAYTNLACRYHAFRYRAHGISRGEASRLIRLDYPAAPLRNIARIIAAAYR